jgi:membrane-associated phospholipid phosphatase
MLLKHFLASLRAMDAVTLLFLLLLSLANMLFSSRIPQWWLLVFLNLTMGAVALYFIFSVRESSSPLRVFFRDWYPVVFTLIFFKELYLMVHPINPHDVDQVFVAIDRWMFGVDPTRWLVQFQHPILTEVLQFSYAMFYFLFLIAGIEYYKDKRMEEFQRGMFITVFGFYLSYVFYFLFPAVGPRFTLHDFHTTNTDLPGLFFTDALREFVNSAESIPPNAMNPVDFAQRDVFPSGHTQLTLVLIYLVFRSQLKSRFFILIVGILLIISTVYLRYHYVVDVIAGVLFMLITVCIGPRLYRWWNQKREVLQR